MAICAKHLRVSRLLYAAQRVALPACDETNLSGFACECVRLLVWVFARLLWTVFRAMSRDLIVGPIQRQYIYTSIYILMNGEDGEQRMDINCVKLLFHFPLSLRERDEHPVKRRAKTHVVCKYMNIGRPLWDV